MRKTTYAVSLTEAERGRPSIEPVDFFTLQLVMLLTCKRSSDMWLGLARYGGVNLGGCKCRRRTAARPGEHHEL